MVGRNKILARASQVSKEGEESDYPAYGVTGPAKEVEARKIFLVMFKTFWLFASFAILLSCTSHLSQASPAGDRKLAQSAQMYHYQVKRTLLVVLQLLLLMMIMKMIMAMMMRAMMTRMRTLALTSTTTMCTLCSTRRTR